jgi:hypothetical protein
VPALNFEVEGDGGGEGEGERGMIKGLHVSERLLREGMALKQYKWELGDFEAREDKYSRELTKGELFSEGLSCVRVRARSRLMIITEEVSLFLAPHILELDHI